MAEQVRIGFIGQLLPHKGLHLLAQALARLSGEWRLLVYGWLGDPGAKEYYESLGLSPERVEFLGTFPFDDMNSVLEGIDVLVVPSLWEENCPLIVKYAIATGTRAVLADQPGIVADRGRLSRVHFFRPGDSDSLRQALAAAMQEAARPQEEERALEKALKSGAVIDIREQAGELEAIYKEE